MTWLYVIAGNQNGLWGNRRHLVKGGVCTIQLKSNSASFSVFEKTHDINHIVKVGSVFELCFGAVCPRPLLYKEHGMRMYCG